MSEKSGFFVSQSGDRKYTPDWLAGYVKALVTTGVYSSELGVVPADGMGVSVSAGRAWIEGYLYLNDSPLELAIATADSALHRRDSVIVRLNMTERTITSMVLTGTCDASPLAPEIIRTADIYDLKIAEIYVAAGTTKITQAMIKDTRLDDSVCGITVSAVQHIPTAAYMEQMEAEFREWFSYVQGILGEDEAGNLLQLLHTHDHDGVYAQKTHASEHGSSGGDPITPEGIGAAPKSHGNHVPKTQTANNATFLRNDNTWQKVTPANIGAVPNTRKVNGKSLSSDITLVPSDLGALWDVTGSYTGNGNYGEDNANVLTFASPPKFLMIQEIDAGAISSYAAAGLAAVRGLTFAYTTTGQNKSAGVYLNWNGNTVSWYCKSKSTNTTEAQNQMNISGRTYLYFAIL